MIHIPPLAITGTIGKVEQWNLTVSRLIVGDRDFEELRFGVYLNKASEGAFLWSQRQWKISVPFESILQIEEIEIIIPLLQKHIAKYDRRAYLAKRLSLDPDTVEYTVECVNAPHTRGERAR